MGSRHPTSIGGNAYRPPPGARRCQKGVFRAYLNTTEEEWSCREMGKSPGGLNTTGWEATYRTYGALRALRRAQLLTRYFRGRMSILVSRVLRIDKGRRKQGVYRARHGFPSHHHDLTFDPLSGLLKQFPTSLRKLRTLVGPLWILMRRIGGKTARLRA